MQARWRQLAAPLFVAIWLLTMQAVAFAQTAAEQAPAATGKPGAQAQAEAAGWPDIQLQQKLLNHEVYPGDPIVLEVTFSSPVAFGADTLGALPLGDFELLTRERNHAEADGRYTITHRFALALFKPGNYETPRIPFVLKHGGEQKEVSSEPTRVVVKSLLEEEAQKIAIQQQRDQQANAQKNAQAPGAKIVQPNAGANQPPVLNLPGQAGQPGQLPPGMQPPQGAPGQPGQPGGPQQIKMEPRDIKPPVKLIVKDYTLAWVGGILLGLIVLGLLIWWWRRRPKKEIVQASGPVVDTRPPHVIAFERLNALEAKQLVAKREIKTYHLELSEILRDYFKRRYDLDVALSMTSSEIVAMLKALYMPNLDDRLVAQLLLAGDLVKFAKDEPTDEICHERLGQARLIVERTKEVANAV